MKKALAVLATSAVVAVTLASCGGTSSSSSTIPDYVKENSLDGYSEMSEEEKTEYQESLKSEDEIHEELSGKTYEINQKYYFIRNQSKTEAIYDLIMNTETGDVQFSGDLGYFSYSLTFVCGDENPYAYLDYSFVNYVYYEDDGISIINKSGKAFLKTDATYGLEEKEDMSRYFERYFNPSNDIFNISKYTCYKDSSNHVKFNCENTASQSMTGKSSGFIEDGLMKEYRTRWFYSGMEIYETGLMTMISSLSKNISVDKASYEAITDETYSNLSRDFTYYSFYLYPEDEFLSYLVSME